MTTTPTEAIGNMTTTAELIALIDTQIQRAESIADQLDDQRRNLQAIRNTLTAIPQAPPPQTENLMDINTAAELLKVSPQTLYNWRQTGRGPLAIKLGATLRYRRADLEQFVNDAASKHTSQRT